MPRKLLVPRSLVWLALNLLAVAALMAFWVDKGIRNPHLTSDGAAYWSVRDGIFYAGHWLQEREGLAHPYVYSPAFAQAVWPLAQLGLREFMAIWVAIQTIAVAWLAGPILAAALVWTYFPLWAQNLWAGHIYPLMAMALALSARYPAAWGFLILTKVTPGVGLIWYAARREWSSLAVAAGATVGVAAVSATLAPQEWVDWLAVLSDAAEQSIDQRLPLAIRLPLAAAFVAAAALRGDRYLLPVGVMLALPQVGLSATPLLLASVYWWRIERHRRLDR